MKLSHCCLCLLAATAHSQYTGNGVSKSTYSCNDPVPAKAWLETYFPTEVPSDECDNDVCTCPASGSDPEWLIQQGRVYLTRSGGGGGGGHAGNGFGLHLVNVSNHLTTGGLSTAEVEAQFVSKLADISTRYDSFLDYNIALSTTADGLVAYKTAFSNASVDYLVGTWNSSDGTQYTSIIVQVPTTQMVLELCAATTLSYSIGEPVPIALEQRVSDEALLTATAQLTSMVGAEIAGLAVNRAASSAAMDKLEAFYVDGMGTKMSYSATTSEYTKKCFLWTGATMDVCYTTRADSATKGDWKVSDFEDMLNTVHGNLMTDHPFCGQDKWEDNHYAIDSRTADTSGIVSYVNSKNPYHYCETSGMTDEVSMHYVWDPTGWGIQMDLSFSDTPTDCSSKAYAPRWAASGDHTNPACTASTDCGSSA